MQDAFFMCRLSSHQSVVSLSVRERKNEEEEKKEEEENKKTSARLRTAREKSREKVRKKSSTS